MIPVCKDIESNGDRSMWFYDDGKYSRFDGKRNLMGHISGQHIPNPQELWKERCTTNGAAYPAETVAHPHTGQTIRLKPTEAVFKLFEHWQGVQSHARVNH